MTITTSTIVLPCMQFYAYHGVMPQERLVGAQFNVSIEAKVCFEKAIYTDELDGTVSYADIYKVVKEEMGIPSNLLEYVAGRIAHRLFQDFSAIENLKIEVMKQNPPMGADILTAGVRIEVKR